MRQAVLSPEFIVVEQNNHGFSCLRLSCRDASFSLNFCTKKLLSFLLRRSRCRLARLLALAKFVWQ